jgi:hypothetical protein
MGDFKYKSQYGLVVQCTNEQEQIMLYEKLKLMGLTVKVVVV